MPSPTTARCNVTLCRDARFRIPVIIAPHRWRASAVPMCAVGTVETAIGVPSPRCYKRRSDLLGPQVVVAAIAASAPADIRVVCLVRLLPQPHPGAHETQRATQLRLAAAPRTDDALALMLGSSLGRLRAVEPAATASLTPPSVVESVDGSTFLATLAYRGRICLTMSNGMPTVSCTRRCLQRR